MQLGYSVETSFFKNNILKQNISEKDFVMRQPIPQKKVITNCHDKMPLQTVTTDCYNK